MCALLLLLLLRAPGRPQRPVTAHARGHVSDLYEVRCTNSLLAGLVAIAGPAAVINPWMAFITGLPPSLPPVQSGHVSSFLPY